MQEVRGSTPLTSTTQRSIQRKGWPFFIAEVAQLVEHQLPKLRVAGSSPVFRSLIKRVLQRSETLFF